MTDKNQFQPGTPAQHHTPNQIKKLRRKNAARRRQDAAQRVRKRYLILLALLSIIAVVGLSIRIIRAVRVNQRLETVYVDISEAPDELGTLFGEALAERDGFRVESRGGRIDPDIRVVPSEQVDSGIPVAADPYILVFDHRFGTPPDALTLPLFEAYLETVRADSVFPLVIAGDEVDFAAVYFYLEHELGSGTASEQTLRRWRSAGYLPDNWLDYDSQALTDAIRTGVAATFIMRRSSFKNLTREERFYLRTRGLPIAETSLQTHEIGFRTLLAAGYGPRNDALQNAAEIILADPVQTRLEEETAWSPVALEGSPLNKDHRDVVRRLRTAAEFIDLSPELLVRSEDAHVRLR